MCSSQRHNLFAALLLTLLMLAAVLAPGKLAAGSEEDFGGTAQLRGVVLPVNRSKLGFTQSGVVILRPLEGVVVEKGDILAKIDDSEARQKMIKARAALAAARLATKQAVRENKKTKLLIAKGIMSDTASVDGEDKIALAKIGVAQAQADIASAEWALRGCNLLAPFAGAVVAVTVHQGEWVGAGSPVLELVDLSQLEVSMDTSPATAQQLRAGMRAEIFTDGQKVGWGDVRVVLPLVDAASGLRRVIWRVHPDQGAVVAGRYVTLEIK